MKFEKSNCGVECGGHDHPSTPKGDGAVFDVQPIGVAASVSLINNGDSGIEGTLHRWFEKEAARRHSFIAASCDGQSLTYGELNAKANRIAHHLKRLGVGPETLVGLYLERSLHLLTGILGILKAGGAYLPLDPVYPPERVAFMAADAKAPIILTEAGLKNSLPAGQARLICLDSDEALFAGESEANPESEVLPHNLAYVIYTSGSTGAPKGSLITHNNVVRLMRATESWYGFNDSDAWTLFHSHAFDFSVWEIWGALLYGGRVVVVPWLTSRSPEDFYRLLVREKVTVLNQTPSAFRQLIHAEERLGASAELALRYVIFGGEALNMAVLKPWFGRHGDARPKLVNMYGITETTVHVTYRPLSEKDVDKSSVIGEPIPDLQLYLLDESLEPVADGTVGEICVGGAGVARGYLNRPDLTAKRFLSDRFANKPSATLYRSGDLGRRLPDGDIEYLGRSDQQVKIRGFRIELGEIESALIGIPGVKQAAVTVGRAADAPDELLACVVVSGEAGARLTLDDARGHLAERLPDYMIPARIFSVGALPLTANGKLDRAALPPSGASQLPRRQSSQAAWSGAEALVVDVFAKALGRAPSAPSDDFFEMGGHSLLATQVISTLRERFGADFSFGDFIAAPTIAGVAATMERAKEATRPALGADPNRPTLIWLGGVPWSPSAWPADLGIHELHLPEHASNLLDDRINGEAAAYVKVLSEKKIGPNAVLGGFCYDGLVAAETARRCAEIGLAPAGVVFVDAIPATWPIRWVGWRFRRRAKANNITTEAAQRMALASFERANRISFWSHLSWRGCLRRVKRFLSRRPRAPHVFTMAGPEEAAMLQRLLERAYWAIAEHHMRPYPGRVTLLLADEMAEERISTTLGRWKRLAKVAEADRVKGTHDSCIRKDANALALKVAEHARRMTQLVSAD